MVCIPNSHRDYGIILLSEVSKTVLQTKHSLEVKKGRNCNCPAFSASWALCRTMVSQACQEASWCLRVVYKENALRLARCGQP